MADPRDSLWDPQYAGVNQPGGFPEYEGQTQAEYKQHQNVWRAAYADHAQRMEQYLTQQAGQGIDADTALANAGYQNEKEQGLNAYTMYGNNGVFATQGAAVDPNLDYDWARGVKTYRAGTENAGQSIPINATEFAEHAKAQKYQQAGLQGYGQQNQASLFNQWGKAHYEGFDPKTGVYSHKNPDGSTSYADQYGRPVNAQGQLTRTGPVNGSPVASLAGQPSGPNGPAAGQQPNGGWAALPPGAGPNGPSGPSGPGVSQWGPNGPQQFPNYTPGSEAVNYSQANYQNELTRQAQNDTLAQQLSLQKGLEGHAMGQGIYNYLTNDVYGKVLGVNFNGNQQGVSQYAQGLNPTQPGQGPGNNTGPGVGQQPNTLADGNNPRGHQPSGPPATIATEQPYAPGQQGPGYGNDTPDHGSFDAQWYLQQNPDVAASGMDPYEHYTKYGKAENRAANANSAGYVNPTGAAQGTLQPGVSTRQAFGPAGTPPPPGAAYRGGGAAQQAYGGGVSAQADSEYTNPDPNNLNGGNPSSGTNGQPSQVSPNQTYTAVPSNPQAAAGLVAHLAQQQASGQLSPDQVAGAIGHIVNELGPGQLGPNEAAILDEIQKLPGFADVIRNPVFTQITSQTNAGWTQPNANLPGLLAGNYPNNMTPPPGGYPDPYAGLPGPPQAGPSAPSALGQALPQGTYTQTGTQSLDPNMSSTWAQFLAPTWNKVNEASQQSMSALDRSMPRGGEQDKAKAQAINQRYGALQQGWQGLVPGALQGISDIGKEMYFQQMTPYSGAASTMQQGAIAGMQNSTALAGIKSNELLAGNQLGENARQFNAGQSQNQNQFDQTLKANQQNNTRQFWGNLGGALLGAAGSVIKSDSRLKKNVSSFAPGLAALRQLDPVAYEYNGKGGTEDGQPGVSVMAQQLEKVMPKAVQMVKTPDGAYRAIDPMAISMATVNAVKELDRRISSLARRNR